MCSGVSQRGWTFDLFYVDTEGLFAQDVHALVDTSECLTCVDVSASGDPDSVHAWVLEEILKFVVSLDTQLLVLGIVIGPFNLVLQLTADCYYSDPPR